MTVLGTQPSKCKKMAQWISALIAQTSLQRMKWRSTLRRSTGDPRTGCKSVGLGQGPNFGLAAKFSGALKVQYGSYGSPYVEVRRVRRKQYPLDCQMVAIFF